MNRSIRWSIGLVIALVAFRSPAASPPPKPAAAETRTGMLSRKQVAADADWLIYINVKQFNASKFGSLFQSDRAPTEIRENLAQSRSVLGFNPLTDMDHLTLYGRAAESQSGVALFTGRFDREKILARVRQQPGVSENKLGNRTVYQWVEPRKGQTMALSLLPAGQLMIAASPEALRQGLEVLDGKQPYLMPGSALSIPENARGFLLATATGSAVKMGPLGNPRGVHLTLGENAGGVVEARMNLLAENEPMALSTQQVLQGLILSALVTAKQNPEWAELAQNAQVSTQGATVSLHVQQPAEQLFNLLTQQMNKRLQASAEPPPPLPPAASAQ